jgi:hypothetical protein
VASSIIDDSFRRSFPVRIKIFSTMLNQRYSQKIYP